MKSNKLIIILVSAMTIIAMIPIVSAYAGDNIDVLFRSWLEGKPKALVRLNINIPKINESDVCFVAVHRFPTPYNPTKNGTSEVIYRGKVPCGSKITVKSLINLVQVGLKKDPKTSELKPVYDSPEYAVVVICRNGYGFNKIIQVSIEKPITDVSVDVELKKPRRNTVSIATTPEEVCNVVITYQDSDKAIGSCVANTKLTYLNSIPGLKVAFGVVGGTPASVMYLESWGSFCFSSDPEEPCPASCWYSDGKKRTVSVVSEETDYITQGERAVVWGTVRYTYEHYAIWDDDFEIYWKYDFFYPTKITNLPSPEVIGSYQQPSTPPWYANGPRKGDATIWFENPKITDTQLSLSTSIGVSIAIYSFSVAVSVHPYKAGEDNTYYTTPYVDVVDVSGKSYDWWYWWYKDDDPMTYEIEFYGE